MTAPGDSHGDHVRITHVPERQRYLIQVDGQDAGHLRYRIEPDGARAFVFTGIAPRFRGRGLARRLVEHALLAARGEGHHVLPYCWVVADHILAHPEHADLVPESRRAQFGITRPPSE